eukprot:1850672-Rhodomonas_salina.3
MSSLCPPLSAYALAMRSPLSAYELPMRFSAICLCPHYALPAICLCPHDALSARLHTLAMQCPLSVYALLHTRAYDCCLELCSFLRPYGTNGRLSLVLTSVVPLSGAARGGLRGCHRSLARTPPGSSSRELNLVSYLDPRPSTLDLLQVDRSDSVGKRLRRAGSPVRVT